MASPVLSSVRPHLKSACFGLALAVPILSTAAPGCADDFAPFLARFERDPAFQLARTREPVVYWRIDHDDPQMRMKRFLVSRKNTQGYEPFPTTTYQARNRLERRLEATSTAGCTVQLRAPDSDKYVVDFRFLKIRSGWLLAEIRDNSL